MPSPVVALPWGSRSTTSTRKPISARAAPRLTAVVVLPTPHFRLAMARVRGRGGGRSSPASDDPPVAAGGPLTCTSGSGDGLPTTYSSPQEGTGGGPSVRGGSARLVRGASAPPSSGPGPGSSGWAWASG